MSDNLGLALAYRAKLKRMMKGIQGGPTNRGRSYKHGSTGNRDDGSSVTKPPYGSRVAKRRAANKQARASRKAHR